MAKKLRLPGDYSASQMLASIIRVNHAGEYGAKRIYQGQLHFLKEPVALAKVQEMEEQEQEHLDYFANKIVKQQIRPTALLPFWHILGFAVGAATALMGTTAAMACTIAVEEAIDEHYSSQLQYLEDSQESPELLATIREFRDDERAHRDTAIDAGGENALGYPLLSAIIKAGSKLAIKLSTCV